MTTAQAKVLLLKLLQSKPPVPFVTARLKFIYWVVVDGIKQTDQEQCRAETTVM